MDELSKRNFRALSDGLKQQRSDNSTQDEKIRQLEANVVTLQQQVALMQGQIAQLMAVNMGTGPTSRG